MSTNRNLDTTGTDDEPRTVSEAVEDHQEERVEEQPKPLGREAPEIIRDAGLIGHERLTRPLGEMAITGFIGGMSVSFGAVALAWAAASVGEGTMGSGASHLAGALAFPVGFVILLVGKSELFTEDFFLPVTGVIEREDSVGSLARLWAVTLAANLLGVLVFSLLISRGEALADAPSEVLIELSEAKVGWDLSTAFVKALFAGWLMTLLTWLLIAAHGFTSRLIIIWIIGSLIVLGEFNHVIISAAEVWIAILVGADIGVLDWLRDNFLPALFGNVVGGVVFVTMLYYIQALTQTQSER